MHVRMGAIVDVPLPVVVRDRLVPGVGIWLGRVVAEERVLQDVVRHVDAEAVHAAIHPEAERGVHRLAESRASAS